MAVAVQGAVLLEQGETMMTYSKKCEKCGMSNQTEIENKNLH